MNNTKNIQMLYSHGLDLKNRRIYLLTDIDEMVVFELLMGLQVLNQTEGGIELWICSGGGELEPTLGLYDAIQRLDPDRNPVHTIASGQACSAALLLLASGHTRSATQNCWGMAHTTYGIVEGDSDGLAARTAMTLAMTSQMWYLLSLHTKKTAKQWKALAKDKRELWLTAEDMVTYGLVDDVIKAHPNRKFMKRPPPMWMPNVKPKAKPVRKKAPVKKKLPELPKSMHDIAQKCSK